MSNHKSIVIFGLGKFGQSVAIELANAGADVLAIDKDEERAHDVAGEVACAMSGDVCDAETLDALGISNMDAAIVAITSNLDASIMATIYAKEAGVPFVFAKAKDDIHGKILRKVGADQVVIPEHASGVRVARQILTGNILDFIELSDRVRMLEIAVRPEWIGHSLQELDLRRREHINVIAIRKGKDVSVHLDPAQPLSEGISLIITMDKRDLYRLMK